MPADAGSLRFSPVWALAELAGFAAPAACKSSSNRAARSIPNRLRCSAAPTGFRDGAPGPVALAEYRSQTGQQERALFEARLDGIFDPVQAPSCARRPVWRGTQGIGASRRGVRVPFSLGTFSWASKRKYLARVGRNPRRDASLTEKTTTSITVYLPPKYGTIPPSTPNPDI